MHLANKAKKNFKKKVTPTRLKASTPLGNIVEAPSIFYKYSQRLRYSNVHSSTLKEWKFYFFIAIDQKELGNVIFKTESFKVLDVNNFTNLLWLWRSVMNSKLHYK